MRQSSILPGALPARVIVAFLLKPDCQIQEYCYGGDKEGEEIRHQVARYLIHHVIRGVTQTQFSAPYLGDVLKDLESVTEYWFYGFWDSSPGQQILNLVFQILQRIVLIIDKVIIHAHVHIIQRLQLI